MPTQFTPPTIQATAPVANVAAPVSPNVGRVPMAASQIPQPLSANQAPKKSHSWVKVGVFLLLLMVLTGGIGVAVYLNSQTQDIRQEADVVTEPTPVPFSFHAPVSGTSILTRTVNGEVDTITANIEFDGSPSCLNGACRANVRVVPDRIPELGPGIRCRLNTSTVVFYNMQTNQNDLAYPANVSLPANGALANCNRPLTGCADGSDTNCERGNLTAYGPPTSQCGGDPYACTYYEAEIPYALRSIDLNCGCSQLDVSVSNLSFLCENDTQTITYNKVGDDASIGGYAYGYSTAQCTVTTPTVTPPTNSPTPTTPPRSTPTPTSPPNSTPTPTTPAVGPMCVSISMSPTAPQLGGTVTFTCGRVAGITEYQFRYFEPGSTEVKPLSTARENISSPLSITKSGNYRAQCRVCPSNADSTNTCANPAWGWDPVPAP